MFLRFMEAKSKTPLDSAVSSGETHRETLRQLRNPRSLAYIFVNFREASVAKAGPSRIAEGHVYFFAGFIGWGIDVFFFFF